MAGQVNRRQVPKGSGARGPSGQGPTCINFRLRPVVRTGRLVNGSPGGGTPRCHGGW